MRVRLTWLTHSNQIARFPIFTAQITQSTIATTQNYPLCNRKCIILIRRNASGFMKPGQEVLVESGGHPHIFRHRVRNDSYEYRDDGGMLTPLWGGPLFVIYGPEEDIPVGPGNGMLWDWNDPINVVSAWTFTDYVLTDPAEELAEKGYLVWQLVFDADRDLPYNDPYDCDPEQPRLFTPEDLDPVLETDRTFLPDTSRWTELCRIRGKAVLDGRLNLKAAGLA